MTTNDDPLSTYRTAYVAGLERTVAEQREAMERAREELEAVEWFPLFVDNGGYGDHWEDTCMRCYNTKDEGHADDCPRDAALAGLRGLQSGWLHVDEKPFSWGHLPGSDWVPSFTERNNKKEDDMADVKKFQRGAFSLTIHDNRLEITDRRGCMGFLMPKRSTIPFRNIASVDVSALTQALVIATNDGKKHTYRMGMGAGKVQQAILERL